MRPEVTYSRMDAYRLLVGIQKPFVVWNPGYNNAFEYCARSFEPIGLVAREVMDENLNRRGYVKTPYGIEVGDSFAGQFLALSETQVMDKISLIQLLGQTGPRKPLPESAEFRPPVLRLKIFWELLTAKLPLRTTDLSQILGIDSSSMAVDHLEPLGDLGFIDYNSAELDKSYVSYTLSENQPDHDPRIPNKMTRLTRQIFEIVSSKHSNELTIDDVMGGLKYIPYRRGYKEIENLRQAVIGVLIDLQKQGYLQSSGYTQTTRSSIDLTSSQRMFLTGVVSMVDRFEQGDRKFIEEGRKIAEDVVQNPQRASALIGKAKMASVFSNKKDLIVRADEILMIIKDNPNVSADDIQEIYVDKFGIRLGKGSFRIYLHHLESRGLIQISAKGSRAYWQASPET